MDIQKFADTFFSPTCVVSVERDDDGGYGDIRIAAGNKKYLDMIEMRMHSDVQDAYETKRNIFVPGALYYDYFPKNRSFEEVCFKAAVQKIPVHTYAHLDNVDIWFDIYAMPLDCEE